MKKKLIPAVFLTAAMVSTTIFAIPFDSETVFAAEKSTDDIVVLYTNDVHNAYVRYAKDGTLGYAAVSAYKKQMEEQNAYVTLIDNGDAIQGGVIGTLSKGSYIVDIMEKTGYDLAVPGNHEFDFGMDNFLDLAKRVKDNGTYEYISCNFMDLATSNTVLQPYKIMDYDGTKVAYIGVTTPETFTKSTPSYFQDANGNYIYGFCEGDNGQELYKQVQETVDKAKTEGADYVILAEHIGTDPASEPWTSEEIIKNTTGVDAVLDGHSHSTIPSETIKNKDGKDVVLSSTGTKLTSLGKLVIKSDGTISSELVTGISEDDTDTLAFVNEITSKFDALEKQVVATTSVDLVVKDPTTGDRIVRSQETNLGDLCADAYRDKTGADIAFVNGGGVRADIKKGDITYGDIVSVHPFGNVACMIEATGQQILDALELGASAASADNTESGGFLQVSGLTYEIDITVPSSVEKDDKGSFVKVNGAYRVKNVMVGDAPLDLNKTYKLASHNYMLKSGGDGYSMFANDTILADEIALDNQVLIEYITGALKGTIAADSIYASPYGDGRIKVITEYVAPTTEAEGYRLIKKGMDTVKEVLPKLEETKPETKEYKIIKGASAVWAKDGKSELVVSSDADFSLFECVKMDGTIVAKENYTAKAGSTIITFKTAYLNTLKEGKHEVIIVSKDGEAKATITITKSATSPKTGEYNDYLLYMMLLVAGSLAAAGAFNRSKVK